MTTYSLSVSDTIKTSWSKVHGAKGSFWAAIGISILIGIAFGILIGCAKNTAPFLSFILSITYQLISGIINFGLLYMGIQRAKNAPLTYKQMFYAFDWLMILRLFGLYLIQFVIYSLLAIIFMLPPMIIIGASIQEAMTSGITPLSLCLIAWFLFAFIATVYLSLRLSLSSLLILDKNVNPWPAIKMSWAATCNNVLSLLGIFLLLALAILAGVLTLGIGFIWVLPLSFILFGQVYTSLLNNAGQQ